MSTIKDIKVLIGDVLCFCTEIGSANASSKHPIYIAGKGWTPVNLLKVGDKIPHFSSGNQAKS